MNNINIDSINMEGSVDTDVAAQMLGCSTSNVCKLCKCGKLKDAVKVGSKVWIIPKQSVLDYKPGPKGFAAVKARKEAAEAERKARDAELVQRALAENAAGMQSK